MKMNRNAVYVAFILKLRTLIIYSTILYQIRKLSDIQRIVHRDIFLQ